MSPLNARGRGSTTASWNLERLGLILVFLVVKFVMKIFFGSYDYAITKNNMSPLIARGRVSPTASWNLERFRWFRSQSISGEIPSHT